MNTTPDRAAVDQMIADWRSRANRLKETATEELAVAEKMEQMCIELEVALFQADQVAS